MVTDVPGDEAALAVPRIYDTEGASNDMYWLLEDELYEVPEILARTLTCPGLCIILLVSHCRVVDDVQEAVAQTVPAAMLAPNAAEGVTSLLPKLRPEIVT